MKKKNARIVFHPSWNPPFQINHPQSHLYSFYMSLFPFIVGNMFEINNEIVTQSMQTNKPPRSIHLKVYHWSEIIKIKLYVYMSFLILTISNSIQFFALSVYFYRLHLCVTLFSCKYSNNFFIVGLDARARVCVCVLPNQNVNEIIPGDRQQFEHDYDVALAH